MSGVTDAIGALARDGVSVKVLTGDNELVTRRVCTSVGLPAAQIVLGQDVERMSEAALAAVGERATVFLGDGINDASSLHAAGVLAGRRAFANVMKYPLMGTSSNFGNMVSMAGAVIFLLESRPSRPLAATTIAVVLIALLLPWSPLMRHVAE
jgi:P-type Mg2+ transporter